MKCPFHPRNPVLQNRIPICGGQEVQHVIALIKKQIDFAPGDIAAIGISYQMHGLVCVDRDMKPLRPSIIWCDSRAVNIGNDALNKLGESFCLEHYLNAPGNFTASKLKWVKDNEPIDL